MPLIIEGKKYNGYASLSEALYLHGNILDEITVKIDYSIERIYFIDDDNHLFLTPPIGVLGSSDNERIIYARDDQSAFAEFQKGDEIVINDTLGNSYYVIEKKLNDQTLLVEGPLPTAELSTTNSYIACSNAPSALKYFYNLKSDNQAIDYNSHLDGQTNLLTAENIDTSGSPYGFGMTQTGSKSHQIGSVTINFVERVAVKLRFQIVHNFRLFPFLKDNYISLLEAGDPLEDWAGDLSYSHIFRLELLAGPNIEDDKIAIESNDDKGNTGAFDENFNTNTTGYSVESVEYKVGSQVVDSIDFNQLTSVKIVYKSNGQFIAPIKSELALLGVHEDYDYYKDPLQTYEQNFCMGIAGSSGILNFSSDYRVFTEYTHTIIDANTLEINAKVSLGSAIKANLNKSSVRRYILLVTCEKTAQLPENQKRSRDIVGISEFSENLPTLNIISTHTKFILDPATEETGFEFENADTFMTDDVVAVSRFTYPSATPIKLLTITNQVIATDGTQTIVLDSFTSPVSGYAVDPFGAQNITVDQQRSLSQSYKTNVTINRGIDVIPNIVFDVAFPFVVGYRDDKALQSQTVPVEFYDNAEAGNGLTADWFKYVDAGWDIYYKIKYTYEYLGKSYSQEFQKLFYINDYDNVEWTAKSIKIYDEDNVELVSGGNKFIKGNCTIVAKFSKPSMPIIGNCFAYFFIAKTGEDGYRTSNVYDNSFKKIIFASLQIVSGELVATGTLDANIIGSNCRIWCRIFERTEEEALECVLITEDYYVFEAEDGNYYLQPETCEVVEAPYMVDNNDNVFISNEGDSFIIIT